MSNVVFLASVQDPTTPTLVHGVGDQYALADEVALRLLQRDGKLALAGASVRAQSVTPIAATTATVNWSVDQACTAMKVDFGTTAAYGSSQAATPAAGSGAILANLTGLTTATVYHYRISVTVGTAVTMTPDATFTTS